MADVDERLARLARALKVARVAAGLSQIEVAEQVGRTRQTVSTWEREDLPTYPGEVMLDKLAELYGIPGGGRTLESAAVREPSVPNYASHRKRLDPQVYERIYGYLDRMQRASCSPEQIEEAERLMTEFAWSKLHADAKREKSVDDQLTDVDASWSAIRESIESRGGPNL